MKIDDIADGLAAREVRLRGRRLTMRRLSAAEQAVLFQQFPEPETHERDDKGRWVERNPNDPTLREQLERRDLVLKAAMIGASLGVEHPEHKKPWSADDASIGRAWLASYADAIAAKLSLQEIGRLYVQELLPLCRGDFDDEAAEQARGN